MRIAVDVMGGDNAPDAILQGCVQAREFLGPDDQLVLFGPKPLMADFLGERGVDDPRIVLEHCTQTIAMEDPPAKAVREKTESSLVRMAVAGSRRVEHPCDAVLSAGNTGACVTAAIMHMRRLPHVHRPGIAVTIPAFHGPVVLCDAGANPEPRPSHLWQYGLMAETYARRVLGIEHPRVALMNIGAEEGKGGDLVKEARRLFKATPDCNYVGYIEGRGFFNGEADVVVTDGFVGNTVLKMAEGLAKSIFSAIAAEIMAFDPALMLKFEPVVKQIYAKNDYHEHGGAPLLGVNGVFMCAHGSSEARTIRAAIRNSRHFVTCGVNDAIVERLAQVASIAEPEPA
ncbi:MAG: phosphate acyltransferase PlsX [Phycisphaerales bacterium]